jgi:signal transduction protein with GAF and PtsI domain
MSSEDRINIETFKIVSKAIAESDNLEVMTDRLCQFLVAALEVKACSVFFLDMEREELERLASFGLSAQYLSKGPVQADKSIGCTLRGEPVVIRDASEDKSLQYPEAAKKEGIRAIISIPVIFLGDVIGVLRLYHDRQWEVSEKDIDSLVVLAEMIGLAMRYTNLLNAAQTFHETLKNLPIDLDRTDRL